MRTFNKALMEDVLANAQTGLWIIELDEGKEPRMYADKTMLTLLGLKYKPTPEECYQEWYSRIAPECIPSVNEAVGILCQKHTGEVSYSWEHPKLGRIFIRCGGTRDMSYQNGISLRGYHQDITALVMLEQEKDGLVKFNETMLLSLKDLFYAIWMADLRTGMARYLHSPKGYELKKDVLMDAEKAVESISTYIHPQDRERFLEDLRLEKFRKLMKQGTKRFVGEYRRMMSDGCHWVSIIAYIAQFEEKAQYVLIAAQDINEQRDKEIRNREALLEAYEEAKMANQAKTDFISKMSHDIRTPLNAILGMAAIAEMNFEDMDCVRECLEKIRTAGESLKELTDTILDMGRIESGKEELRMKRFSVVDLLKKCLDMLDSKIKEKNLSVRLEMEGIQQPQIMGDKGKLEKVFLNILSNAVKYTPNGGEISVWAEEQPSIQEGYGRYQFRFQDTGIGMSQEFQKKIFEPYVRDKNHFVEDSEGSGLGMVIAYNMMQLMKGELRVKSRLGKGSCFTVDVNLMHGTEPPRSEKNVDEKKLLAQTDFGGMRVLLAEDNELNVEIAEAMLHMIGVVCETVPDGEEAVKAFYEHPAEYYQMIFMDIQMPVMNGYEAAGKIRTSGKTDGKTVPIIAMTANAFQEDVQVATNAGMNAHIAKPIDIVRLIEIINEMRTDS